MLRQPLQISAIFGRDLRSKALLGDDWKSTEVVLSSRWRLFLHYDYAVSESWSNHTEVGMTRNSGTSGFSAKSTVLLGKHQKLKLSCFNLTFWKILHVFPDPFSRPCCLRQSLAIRLKFEMNGGGFAGAIFESKIPCKEKIFPISKSFKRVAFVLTSEAQVHSRKPLSSVRYDTGHRCHPYLTQGVVALSQMRSVHLEADGTWSQPMNLSMSNRVKIRGKAGKTLPRMPPAETSHVIAEENSWGVRGLASLSSREWKLVCVKSAWRPRNIKIHRV